MFLLGSLTVTLTILFFGISFLLLALVFLLWWLFLDQEILIMLLSLFPITFCQTQNKMPSFIIYLVTILVLIGMVFVIIWEIFHGRISLNLVLLLLVTFWTRFSLELTHIFLMVGIRSNLTHFHGFQPLEVLP